jgi:hypothetical protein
MGMFSSVGIFPQNDWPFCLPLKRLSALYHVLGLTKNGPLVKSRGWVYNGPLLGLLVHCAAG